MSESQFRTYIKKKIKDYAVQLSHIDVVSIESYTSRGIPDINLCFNGFEAWIECKYEKGNQIKLRPEQKNWIKHRTNCGGNVFILVRRQTAKKDSIELWGSSLLDNLPNNNPTLHAYKKSLLFEAVKKGNSFDGLETIIKNLIGEYFKKEVEIQH